MSALGEGAPDPVFTEALAPAERMSRAKLIGFGERYFNGIEQGNGDMVGFDPQCDRVENGVQTTNRTAPVPNVEQAAGNSAAPGAFNLGRLGCREQFNTGMFGYITKIHDRRYPVVDEERGLVLAFVIFAHPGTVKTANVPGVGVMPMPASALRPFDTDLTELFKIKAGKLRRVEAVVASMPYGMPSAWPAK